MAPVSEIAVSKVVIGVGIMWFIVGKSILTKLSTTIL